MAEIAKAKVKYVRAIPWKARRVINLVRGKQIDEAINIVSFLPHSIAKVIKKLLKSALANAGQRKGISKENLYIEKIFVDQGPMLKRFRPAPMGRGMTVFKRMSHITVILGEKEFKRSRSPVSLTVKSPRQKNVKKKKIDKPVEKVKKTRKRKAKSKI